ncbi:MAG: hypothetical protein JJE04_07345 [Acidobacteriia bacterium]|nr:hypothetical protein [Terriglobia bacterium]
MSVDFSVTVVGAKGRETKRDIGLGPVASRVVEHADGCILVGRELQSPSGFRALIAVDGSAAGYRTVATAHRCSTSRRLT